MGKFKRDLLIGITGGFITGAIFLIGDGLSGMVNGRLSDRIKVGVSIVLFGIVFFYVKNMKK